MATDVPLRCACGAIRGVASSVSPGAGCRVVCYCDDCQAYARFLRQPGVTDEWGGTDVYQMAPGRLRLTQGLEALACVRLSDKGMHRWYCGQCRTPIGNTFKPGIPFVGVVHNFMDHAGDGRSRDQVLGPPLAHSQTKFAKGTPPVRSGTAQLLKVIGRSLRLLSTWWVTGAGKPSPFFDDRAAPRATPRVLTPEERRAL